METLTADQQRVKDMVAVFNTPIVFHPGGWDDTLPEWLRLRVIAERVEMVCNGGWKKATDAEVTCYLYTRSMSGPLDSNWTAITLYQAAKQVPQLREALPATPLELSDYQKRELEDLKHEIRDSQQRRKKEVTMARKIVIDEKEGSVLLGIMKENADPVMKTIEGTLDQALASLPGFITLAEAKWATSPRNPAYKAPPEPPKPKPAEHPVVKQARQEAEAKELSEKGKPAAATKPEAMGIHVPDEGNLVKAAPVPVVASQAKQVIDLPPRGTPPTEQAPATSGQWEYYLEDGQGPYPTVQAAMDQVGLDKATRPSHNRWDRLSTELKKKIVRREAATGAAKKA